jgi:Skp family chaperone for outer membrane proteins
MRKRIAVAAALLVIAGAGVAAAHMKRGTPEQHAERLVERVTKELSLDAGQQERFGKLLAEFQPVAEQLRTAREATRANLGVQLKAGAIDAEALKSATHANLAALQTSADQFIERLAAFYATLNPSQKTKVAETFEKFEDWRGDEGCRGGRRHRGRHEEKHELK